MQADQIFINNYLTIQSPDIAPGGDATGAEGKTHEEQGAGDQGIMFGYACNETPELMPAPIMYAHRLGRELTRIRKAGKAAKWLRPDAKSQVSVEYVDGKPTRIVNVVISTQHAADVSHAEIEKFCIEQVIKKVLPKNMLTKDTEYLINPTGKFVVGGPQGDSGLTGRDRARVVWSLARYVHGSARALMETRAATDATGVDENEWWFARSAMLDELAPDYADQFPALTSIRADGGFDQVGESDSYLEAEARDTFEFGLARLLDGVESLVRATRKG